MSGLTPGIVREVDPAHPGAMDSADAAFQFDVLTKFAEVSSEELNESLQRPAFTMRHRLHFPLPRHTEDLLEHRTELP
jgi:hypothetical protein